MSLCNRVLIEVLKCDTVWFQPPSLQTPYAAMAAARMRSNKKNEVRLLPSLSSLCLSEPLPEEDSVEDPSSDGGVFVVSTGAGVVLVGTTSWTTS